MTKEEKFIKKWERASKNGKMAYIIKIALIFLIVAPIVAIFIDLAFKGDFSQKAITEILTVRYVIVKVIIFGIVGVFSAYSSWNRGEKKYQIYKEYVESKDE